MLQYKRRAFKKPLTNANILKVSFHFLHPRHKHIAVEMNEQEINYWDRWICEEVRWFFRAGLPDTELHSVTLKSRLSAAICRMGTPLAHDVKPFVQNAQYYQTFKNDVISVTILFLGAFAKLRKATIGSVMSVGPHGRTRLPLDGFSW